MIALGQIRVTPLGVWRLLACSMLITSALVGHAQENVVKTNSKEGTLVVNYYSMAPDPELEQLRGLAVEALGLSLIHI